MNKNKYGYLNKNKDSEELGEKSGSDYFGDVFRFKKVMEENEVSNKRNKR